MFKIIDEISNDNSKLHKEAVLVREATADNDELFAGLKMCYNPMITFGVKQIPEHMNPQSGQNLDWEEFYDLANKLELRDLTGHDARDAIEAAMNTASVAQWNGWYRKILISFTKALAQTCVMQNLMQPMMNCEQHAKEHKYSTPLQLFPKGLILWSENVATGCLAEKNSA